MSILTPRGNGPCGKQRDNKIAGDNTPKESTLWALINRRYFAMALIEADVRWAGVIRAVLKREYHVFESYIFSKFGILHS